MPLDPRIALGVQIPEPPEPVDHAARQASLANIAQQQELRQTQIDQEKLQNAQLRQQAERAKRVQGILWKHEGDIEKALPEVYAEDPKAADMLSDHLNKRQKEMREAAEQERKAAVQKSARLGAIVGTVNDPASYERAKQMALKEGLVTQDDLKFLPQGYTTDAIKMLDQLKQAGLTIEQQEAARLKAADERRKQDEHDAEVGGKRAKSLSEVQAGAAQTMRDATGQEDWTAKKNAYIQSLPEHYRQFAATQIPDEFSTDSANQVAARGLTAQQYMDAQEKKTDQAETKRRNAATEAQTEKRDTENAGARREANQIRREALDKQGAQTRNSQAIDARAKEREAREAQKQADRIEQDQGDITAKKKELVARATWLESKKPAGKRNGKDWEQEAAEVRAQIEKLDEQHKQKQREKEDLIRRKDDIYEAVKDLKGGGAEAPAPTGARQRARNPKTGEIVEWDGKAWVKVQ